MSAMDRRAENVPDAREGYRAFVDEREPSGGDTDVSSAY